MQVLAQRVTGHTAEEGQRFGVHRRARQLQQVTSQFQPVATVAANLSDVQSIQLLQTLLQPSEV